MCEHASPENLRSTREDLLKQAIEQLFSVAKNIHKSTAPPGLFLSPPQARLAFAISRYKERGVSVKELAEKAEVTPGAITQLVDVLISKDLVKREADPGDRRVVRLKITPAAERHLHAFRKEFLATASRAFEVLSTDELKQLTNLLARVCPRNNDRGKHHLLFE